MNGIAPLAITMLRAVMRRPSTSTVHGSTILALPVTQSTPSGRIPLDRIVGRDRRNRIANALHHGGEIDAAGDITQTVALRVLEVMRDLRGADQRLARHTAGVQATSPPIRLRSIRRHLGARTVRRDQRCDQAGRAGADHDQVRIEPFRS